MGAHCRGLSFQALVAPRVLQTEEFSQIWRTRMATLARLPRILDDIPQMDADRKGVTWDILLTDRVVVATDGKVTIATTSPVYGPRGNIVGEQETILPKPTGWVGGLHAVLQHGIKQSLINSHGFQLFTMAFQIPDHLRCSGYEKPYRQVQLRRPSEEGKKSSDMRSRSSKHCCDRILKLVR